MENQKTEVFNISAEELITRVKKALDDSIEKAVSSEVEEPCNTPEIAEFCGESKSWVYEMVRHGLPHYKFKGKNSSLKFFKSEVVQWLKEKDVKVKANIDYKNAAWYSKDDV